MPLPISSQLIAYIRNTSAAFLTDTCTIERNHEVTDSKYGSKKQGWVVVADNVPCRVTTLNRSNRSLVDEIGSQETLLDSYQLVIGYDVEVERDYRVTVGGATYFVTRIESHLTDIAFKQALITRKRA